MILKCSNLPRDKEAQPRNGRLRGCLVQKNYPKLKGERQAAAL